MEEALARLRPEWALTRNGDAWSVCRIWEDYDNVDTLQGIGFGGTIEEALTAAEAWTANEERERAERLAHPTSGDPAISVYMPAMWQAEIVRAIHPMRSVNLF